MGSQFKTLSHWQQHQYPCELHRKCITLLYVTPLTRILLSFFWILCETMSAQYFSRRKSQKIRPIRALIQAGGGPSMWQHMSCLEKATVTWGWCDSCCPRLSDLGSVTLRPEECTFNGVCSIPVVLWASDYGRGRLGSSCLNELH